MNLKQSVSTTSKINWDEYFSYIEEFFKLFNKNQSNLNRKKITDHKKKTLRIFYLLDHGSHYQSYRQHMSLNQILIAVI